jgi:hypothetical protein
MCIHDSGRGIVGLYQPYVGDIISVQQIRVNIEAFAVSIQNVNRDLMTHQRCAMICSHFCPFNCVFSSSITPWFSTKRKITHNLIINNSTDITSIYSPGAMAVNTKIPIRCGLGAVRVESNGFDTILLHVGHIKHFFLCSNM